MSEDYSYMYTCDLIGEIGKGWELTPWGRNRVVNTGEGKVGKNDNVDFLKTTRNHTI